MPSTTLSTHLILREPISHYTPTSFQPERKPVSTKITELLAVLRRTAPLALPLVQDTGDSKVDKLYSHQSSNTHPSDPWLNNPDECEKSNPVSVFRTECLSLNSNTSLGVKVRLPERINIFSASVLCLQAQPPRTAKGCWPDTVSDTQSPDQK